MAMIESEFTIRYQYRSYFTYDTFAVSNPLLADLVRDLPCVLFFYEEELGKIFPALPDSIRTYCRAHGLHCTGVIPLPGGESCKEMSFVMKVCEELLQGKVCRQSCAAAIGGGAFLDAVGLGCALFHRGVRHIRIPTTALSQCDSGVGVKNGVNGFGRKNLLGTFAPPYAVISDSRFLEQLPMRERLGAVAEAVKVAAIKDADFFAGLERCAAPIVKGELDPLIRVIQRSAELHMNHIATNGDPFEYGEARPLDFGHWSAHRMETMSNAQIRHGEAVADGMRIDTMYAVLRGIAPRETADRLHALLDELHLPVHTEYLRQRAANGNRLILEGLEEFREHLGGVMHITLPQEIGSKIEVTEMDPDLLEKAIAITAGELE